MFHLFQIPVGQYSIPWNTYQNIITAWIDLHPQNSPFHLFKFYLLSPSVKIVAYVNSPHSFLKFNAWFWVNHLTGWVSPTYFWYLVFWWNFRIYFLLRAVVNYNFSILFASATHQCALFPWTPTQSFHSALMILQSYHLLFDSDIPNGQFSIVVTSRHQMIFQSKSSDLCILELESVNNGVFYPEVMNFDVVIFASCKNDIRFCVMVLNASNSQTVGPKHSYGSWFLNIKDFSKSFLICGKE